MDDPRVPDTGKDGAYLDRGARAGQNWLESVRLELDQPWAPAGTAVKATATTVSAWPGPLTAGFTSKPFLPTAEDPRAYVAPADRRGRPADLRRTVAGPAGGRGLRRRSQGAATSNVNVRAGGTSPNTVTVPLGADGKVLAQLNSGQGHVVVDFVGYHQPNTGDRFDPITPTRLADTRTADGALGGGRTRTGKVEAGPDRKSLPIGAIRSGSWGIRPFGHETPVKPRRMVRHICRWHGESGSNT
ncbi:hypothetical protein ABT237_18580 [Streptomyces sp. NPDC001581]|uniref:hypothetical protein n=1 Tax=Streptomyces sp. NPDC001581 TaxID=3154386 RepID=UPI00331AAC99